MESSFTVTSPYLWFLTLYFPVTVVSTSKLNVGDCPHHVLLIINGFFFFFFFFITRELFWALKKRGMYSSWEKARSLVFSRKTLFKPDLELFRVQWTIEPTHAARRLSERLCCSSGPQIASSLLMLKFSSDNNSTQTWYNAGYLGQHQCHLNSKEGMCASLWCLGRGLPWIPQTCEGLDFGQDADHGALR